MRYISTRGKAPARDFGQVLLAGLAEDGGLYVPETLPNFSVAEIETWRELNYPQLALKIVRPFVGDAVPRDDLQHIIQQAYAGFACSEVTPLRELSPGSSSAPPHYLLELFHGPTLAFKDLALQVLGRLLDYVLVRDRQRAVILGATSGDTGSAALEGCRHSERVDIFILHPHGRVSEVQRRQMTTVPGNNVFNIAIKGSFDDCQRLVKAAFRQQFFLSALPEGERCLVAVNSINWARIMMQTVYYFAATLRLGTPLQSVSFSVPTGNFGDVYAGYLAKKMGLPVERLIVATNSNDILHRFISANDYSATQLQHTFSPSMDILVSSNFERYLFDLLQRDSMALTRFMDAAAVGPCSVSHAQWQQVRETFSSARVDDATTCRTIADEFAASGLLLDPHSAVGLSAARACDSAVKSPIVTLATAHPAKFGEAVAAAGLSAPSLPARLADLFQRQEHYQIMDNEFDQVTNYIRQKLTQKQIS